MTPDPESQSESEKPPYVLVIAGWDEDLADKVSNWMERGYKPQGGVAVVCMPENDEPTKFYQAMVLAGYAYKH